jgi:hypothetical protein
VKKDPTTRHIAATVRSIDKALAESEDVATRQALDEARATLGAVLSLNGAAHGSIGWRRRAARPERADQVQAEKVLQYLASHPGSRCEDIAAAVGAKTKAVTGAFKAIKTAGRVRSEGQARGMQYLLVASR